MKNKMGEYVMTILGGLCEYRQFFEKIGQRNYFGRLGKVFKTEKNYYFYDMGTGKIAKVNEDVYLVLKTLTEKHSFDEILKLDMSENTLLYALNDIKKGIEEEFILSALPLTTLTGAPVLQLEEKLKYEVNGIVLEVTEKCNLRCKYCIYHPDHPEHRDFGHQNMSFETAKKAIDFLKTHSSKKQDVVVGFYGGEPLLNFELIRQCVAYSKEIMWDKKVDFSMTTNATQITPEIAEFIVDNKMNVIISLDGPKELHDENRVYTDGRGSFEDVICGTKLLLEAQKKLHSSFNKFAFTFNMVIDGENVIEKYSKVQEFFDHNSWLPPNMQVLVSAIETGPKECDYVWPQSREEREIYLGKVEPIIYWSKCVAKDNTEQLFLEAYLKKGLTRIHNRFYTEKPMQVYGMNGCCVPGHRSIYITVDGDFYPCEKVGDIPSIGNVNEGFKLEKIKKHYIHDFIEEAKKYCKNCWAVNLCGLCYNDCYDKNGIHYNYRHDSCLEERFYLHNLLSIYHSILENDPDSIEVLNGLELT